MAPAARKRLTLDTNVPLDLADREPSVVEFHRLVLERGFALAVTSTVLHELALLTEDANAERCRLSALALANLRSWQIQPIDMLPVGHALTQRFAEILSERKLLPSEEFNDGLILAESALAMFPGLVTSDSHLLDIPQTDLQVAFADCGLEQVHVAHPFRFSEALRGIRQT